MKQLSKHLNFANAISCIALFVALSGAAYAATTTLGKKSVKTQNLANGSVSALKLRNGSVTTLKIKNGAVTGPKIGPGAVGASALAAGSVRSSQLGGGVVTGSKLKNEAVTTSKIAPENVTAASIKSGTITENQLSSSFLAPFVKSVTFVASPGVLAPSPNLRTVTAECLPGPGKRRVIGGGARIFGANTKITLIESAPKIDANGNWIGWNVSANELEEVTENWGIEAYAICANV
jgi:hypothetical protein